MKGRSVSIDTGTRANPLWPAVVSAIVGVAVFVFLAIPVSSGRPLPFDRIAADAVRALENRALSLFFIAVTFTASTVGTTVVGLFLCAAQWLLSRRFRHVVAVASTLGTSMTAGLLLKRVFARPRPSWYPWLLDATGQSFPSGHTLAALTMAGLILWIGRKPGKSAHNAALAIPLVLWVALVGISRIYLGVHYASDVVAAVGAGTVFLSVAYVLTKRIITWKQSKQS